MRQKRFHSKYTCLCPKRRSCSKRVRTCFFSASTQLSKKNKKATPQADTTTPPPKPPAAAATSHNKKKRPKPTHLPIVDEIGDTSRIRPHHRHPARHGLEHDKAKRLRLRRHDENVRRGKRLAQSFARHLARKHGLGALKVLLQSFRVRSSAHQRQSGVWDSARGKRGGVTVERERGPRHGGRGRGGGGGG